ncbi:uncharacterized protein MELLADRAFT_85314 [Melampsora larici-populina 98AG31]|uniref:Uncharacterized protein n=1 Tax=Melampsora larici-populina (strain 98AG31 / pathotype 3-4-7) TaxID=747676 RepID=F4RIB8_MELLP|nr:uncharacterized protein MELLADRAFT_85314 [Melampsora larici-populina 98AG31]EGG07992.1 hypothetical protein MELLADRAFT_85314 [Melampsora larici-populina 98AG31]
MTNKYRPSHDIPNHQLFLFSNTSLYNNALLSIFYYKGMSLISNIHLFRTFRFLITWYFSHSFFILHFAPHILRIFYLF